MRSLGAAPVAERVPSAGLALLGAMRWFLASALLHGLPAALTPVVPRAQTPAHASVELELIVESPPSGAVAREGTNGAAAESGAAPVAERSARATRRFDPGAVRLAAPAPAREARGEAKPPVVAAGASSRGADTPAAATAAVPSAAPRTETTATDLRRTAPQGSSSAVPVAPAPADPRAIVARTMPASNGATMTNGVAMDPAMVGSRISARALGGGFGRGITAPGAGATPGPDASAVRSRYLRELRARVQAHREYPHAAQRAGLQGIVCLRLSVTAAGHVSELRATCGPSPQQLVDAALRAVRAAEPFAPLPSDLGSELMVDLPIVFRLDAP